MPETKKEWEQREAAAFKYYQKKYGRSRAILAMASWRAANPPPSSHSFRSSPNLVLPQSSRGDTFYGGGHQQHFNMPR